MKEIIEQTLNVLINMQLKDIGRAADLGWFVFSSIYNREDDMESENMNLEYTTMQNVHGGFLAPRALLLLPETVITRQEMIHTKTTRISIGIYQEVIAVTKEHPNS